VRSTNRVGGEEMPTVVVPRCFLDGEYTVDEIEVTFDQQAVCELRSELMRRFPKLDRRITNSQGEPVNWFDLVRHSDGEFVFNEDVVDATERVYLVNRIGC
jgi:hypothetical protein